MVLGKSRVSPTSSIEGNRSLHQVYDCDKSSKSTSALTSAISMQDDGPTRPQSFEGNPPRGLTLDNRAMQKDSIALADLTGTQCDDNDSNMMSLADYFQHVEELDFVDTDYLKQLVANGADLNAPDERGNRPVHYIAMAGSMELAEFLFRNGTDFSVLDANGYHPLHLAACADSASLVEYLLHDVGVDMDVRTSGDRLTAVHCAARLNSLDSLRVLINAGANYELQDYRGRTPLHLAAEYDRSLSAQYLLGLSPPARCDVRDFGGLMALSVMVQNMPKMAEMALNSTQIWEKDTNKGKQKFYLLKLERELASQHWTPSVFHQIVEGKNYDLLVHSSVQKLLNVKWKFVRPLFIFQCILYAIFLLSWTILLAYPSTQEFHRYPFPTSVWRVVLWLVALGLLLFQIGEEVHEVIWGKLKHKHFAQWHKCGLLQDMGFLQDPHMAHLKEYVAEHLARIRLRGSCLAYLKNLGNLMDISAYLSLAITFTLHLVDVSIHHLTDVVAVWQSKLSCLAILLIWLRVLKYARAFSSLGPFIIIIGYALKDILRYVFVFAVFITPFSVCFWIVFGGRVDDPSVSTLPRVVFMLYRVSLVDEYPFEALSSVDEVMTIILVGLYLWVTAVVGLNLFIALLSYTFQRVYDNATANAQLQRSEIILDLDLKLPRFLYRRYQRYMEDSCDPFVCGFDDDDYISGVGNTRTSTAVVKQLKEVLHQQKEMMGELQKALSTLPREQERGPSASSQCPAPATRLHDDTPARPHTSLFKHLVAATAQDKEYTDKPGPSQPHVPDSSGLPVRSQSVFGDRANVLSRWKGYPDLA